MRLQHLIILLLLICTSTVFAEQYAGEFLLDVESPRAASMGGVGHLLQADAFTTVRNPAWLSKSSQPLASLVHTDRFNGVVRSDFAGVTVPAEQGMHGFALYRLAVEQIPYTQLADPSQPLSGANRPVVYRMASDQEWAMWAGTGRQINDKFSVGASVKPMWKQLGGGTAIGLGVDAGALYQFSEHTIASAVISDVVVSPLRWNTGRTETIKPRVASGFSHRFSIQRLHADVLLAAAGEARFDQARNEVISGHGGIEYCIEQTLALRGGYDKDQLVYGAGIKLKTMTFDYAYRNVEAGVVHTIGCNILWN